MEDSGGGEDGPSIAPGGAEDIHCGFFDLNSLDAVELVVYDPSSNGFAAFLSVSKECVELLSWHYTGEETAFGAGEA